MNGGPTRNASPRIRQVAEEVTAIAREFQQHTDPTKNEHITYVAKCLKEGRAEEARTYMQGVVADSYLNEAEKARFLKTLTPQ